MERKSYKVVLPFFVYAALTFLVSMGLLTLHANSFLGFHVEPNVLTITHLMGLGWASMIVLGSTYQLIPFLNRVPLYSYKLAKLSFVLLGLGIPLLVYSFSTFIFNWSSFSGGVLIISSYFCLLFNIGKTIQSQKILNIHSIYIFISIVWLILTASIGLLMVLNFKYPLLSHDSIHYLSFHAHVGIVGWLLILIIGVSSRLFPMFLMSEYENDKLLKIILGTINVGLVLYIINYVAVFSFSIVALSFVLIAGSLLSYFYYSFQVYRCRFRKTKTQFFNLSTASLFFLTLPIAILFLLILALLNENATQLILVYGFVIFFGWITTLIMGMTFKILPYIVWTFWRAEKRNALSCSPLDLYRKDVFNVMSIVYLLGVILFILGILLLQLVVLKFASFLLVIAAILYNYNVFKIVFFKPQLHETYK